MASRGASYIGTTHGGYQPGPGGGRLKKPKNRVNWPVRQRASRSDAAFLKRALSRPEGKGPR